MRSVLRFFYRQFRSLFFDPREVIYKWMGLPYFVSNLLVYKQSNQDSKFPVRLKNILYYSYERFHSGGTATGHYFNQDLWAACIVYQRGIKRLIDLGSRVDGFVAHVLPYCEVCVVDIRHIDVQVEGMTFVKATIEDLPFESNSIPALSCLHVLEHIGLGRYGDRVNPKGYLCAASEISRVLQPKGLLILGTPVGKERLCFDAHRIFDPQTVVDAFSRLHLEQFSLVDDSGVGIVKDATFARARCCSNGHGLFLFKKL